METIINTIWPFFEEPEREFYIREISRILKTNHTSVRQHLNRLAKQGLLEIKKGSGRIYPSYSLVLTKAALNLKLYYNLEKLRKSGLIEKLEEFYEYPPIALFGSYSQARDGIGSDVDIFILSEVNKEFDLAKYEKTLNRKISLHLFNKKKFDELIKSKSGLMNNIINGVILSGQLEVFK